MVKFTHKNGFTMKVLGIDQSYTSTGLVILEGEELEYHDIIAEPKKTKDFIEKISNATSISENIQKLVRLYQIKLVVIEGLAFASFGDATRNLAALQALIIAKLQELGGVKVVIVPPTSLKKKACGNGRAKKEEVFEALPEDVKEVFGKLPKTKGRYDLTDAYFLAQIGSREHLVGTILE